MGFVDGGITRSSSPRSQPLYAEDAEDLTRDVMR
ncbi:predicted protein [Botrytis cinerea T4]|uniref:Uncharacterized protein n=1 Tax=Botryotinia fuckeliana (strain T4) TaxID=999810 RepID=G2XQ86_BOTF4|nr:predicted protein [Botrytis cinerea T4]